MKKYFVLALALVVFAVAPVMADAKVGGEFRYGGMWDTGEEEYVGDITRLRFTIDSAIDDYNTFSGRLGQKNVVTDVAVDADVVTVDDSGSGDTFDVLSSDTELAGSASKGVAVDYAFLTTDWGKYFGLTDMGFGFSTSVGLNEAFETEDVVGFTIYDFGGEGLAIEDTAAIRFDFDVMGMVKPYFATSFQAFDDVQGKDVKEYILGAVVDVAPVTASVYFGQVGADKMEGRVFGLDAQGSMEVADGVDLTVGGVFEMMSTDADEWAWGYLFGASAAAYGATVDLALFGVDDTVDTYALSRMALSAKYDILAFLGVQAGMQMAFGDYAKNYANDEAFQGAEFGLYMTPGKSKYGLGYVMINEDSAGYELHDGPLGNSTTKGGIYFTAQSKF